MAYCKASQLDMHGFCNRFDCPCIKQNCRFFGVKTNADRIRAMSDEELALMLANEIPHDCHNCRLVCATYEEDKFVGSCQNAFYRWLQQPAEGE